jgi:hypothetical protein
VSALAMHEAAHAVIAWRNGIELASVSIVSHEGSGGRTIAYFEQGPPEAAIKTLYAGFLAELRVVERDGPQPGVNVHGSDTDFEIAKSIAEVWGPDADRRLGELMTAALLEVDANWSLIERLASELDECPYLNSLEIERILNTNSTAGILVERTRWQCIP